MTEFLHFCVARGVIVTCNANGSIPINSKVVATPEKGGNTNVCQKMLQQANDTARLAAVLSRVLECTSLKPPEFQAAVSALTGAGFPVPTLLAETAAEIARRMLAEGYDSDNRGGGIEAWRKDLDDGSFILINTQDSDLHAPMADRVWQMGRYKEPEDDAPDDAATTDLGYGTGMTLAEALEQARAVALNLGCGFCAGVLVGGLDDAENQEVETTHQQWRCPTCGNWNDRAPETPINGNPVVGG